ncbi:hypothetical protein K490DRAFT_41270 [Saccharata proteae CBS 121410]|uniref:Septin-type G domain-containing protein n=1 Tax=Saccharata proteae CBS 121410 TaxID=1314787 RepID=A0A9P4HVW4_9PEZI|nr:hypothetical protein K490DRAFT_41270 [Saccharata proteae CBS 121410]
MKPPVSGDRPPPAARKSSTERARAAPTPVGPATFFLRSEEEMQQAVGKAKDSPAQSAANLLKDSPKDGPYENNFGVQSLDDALGSAFGDKPEAARDNSKSPQVDGPRLQGHVATDLASASSSPSRMPRKASPPSFSQPLTPLHLMSPGLASDEPSTPKSVSIRSFRLSDEESQLDEVASQAMTSSGEEDDEPQDDVRVPQFVMPSMEMPARRPFTEKGKSMGKLKVLVAGEAGAGKTSLIRSIVQLCEDIVHVDPLVSKTPALIGPAMPKSKPRRRRQTTNTDLNSITEIYASTKAYPSWWSEMEESRVLRRRKSMGESVLERNICFVDTPAYDPQNLKGHAEPTVRYIESLLNRNTSVTDMSDGDLLGVLSGNGGVQVDIVFLVLTPSTDTDFSLHVPHIRELSNLTNVVLLFGHSDTLNPSQVSSYKTTLLHHLSVASVRPFLFGHTIEDALLAAEDREKDTFSESFDSKTRTFPGPFAVTSASASDDDVMDASLLMSPDYIQPLVPSELSVLVNQVFNPDTISWLRHSAVKKFLRWRHERTIHDTLNMHVLIPRPFPFNQSSPFASPSPQSPPLSASASHDYTLARLADHTQREERLAQVRLAKWAADLQRSLANERRRFEELERSKRARWLLDRVDEEVIDGRILPQEADRNWALARRDAGVVTRVSGGAGWSYGGHCANKEVMGRRCVDPRDPLGLCDWGDEVRRSGWVVVQVLGGVGVLGAVVVAVCRAWGVEPVPQGLGAWGWFGNWAE